MKNQSKTEIIKVLLPIQVIGKLTNLAKSKHKTIDEVAEEFLEARLQKEKATI